MGLLQTTSTISAPKDEVITPLKSIEEFPIPIYQFSVEIDNATVALFQSVSGITVTREIEPNPEGGQNDFGREFPGQIGFGHVTFGVGLTSSDFFWKWMMAGKREARTSSKNFTLVQRRPNPEGGKQIFVEVKKWNFFNAFPVSWKLSDLTLSDSQGIVIETLELSFDYFELA